MTVDRRKKITPPASLRCARQNGRYWRCKNWRLHDKLLCQIHYFEQQALLQQGKSLPSRAIATPRHGNREQGETVPARKRKRGRRKKVVDAVEMRKPSQLQNYAPTSE